MHSGVFKISHMPVPAAKRVRAGNLPAWFYEQVCDYAENPSQSQAIGRSRQKFGSLCALDEGKLAISPHIRETYFRDSCRHFKMAAEPLAQTDYEAFSGSGNTALVVVLDKLNSGCENRRGVYIYLTESGELVTLDRWIRTADFSKPFYIGGTINYHC